MNRGPNPEATAQSPSERKLRGAFYTPPAIAQFLAAWAVANRRTARVLDPTCGEGVFLQAAGLELQRLGALAPFDGQLFGVDVHAPALDATISTLGESNLDAHLIAEDFFGIEPPGSMFSRLPEFDTVIGNPPFIRYQNHTGESRVASRAAALRQGVRLSGLASSWAALLVHAGGFLAPNGRLAMVLPAELLTVGYAEPVRRWLRRRFAAVKLVIFERLQFAGALENVVLLLAQGSGGCDAFSLYFVDDANELAVMGLEEYAVTLSSDSKWTDLLLSVPQRQLFRKVAAQHFSALVDYGSTALGTVTGANHYFTLNESTRLKFGLLENRHLVRITPPGTKLLKGLTFSGSDWERLRDADERVWMLWPKDNADNSEELRRYVEYGEDIGIPTAYKCQIRTPWWKPPLTSPPDVFFTYMSHRFPRLIANRANVSFVNSMHGLRYHERTPRITRDALPLLVLNSVTMLGAELYGRSYGGGILKMEPREASTLPVPKDDLVERAWQVLRSERDSLDYQLRNGRWTTVVARVDEVLLRQVCGLSFDEVAVLRGAGQSLRTRRLSRSVSINDES